MEDLITEYPNSEDIQYGYTVIPGSEGIIWITTDKNGKRHTTTIKIDPTQEQINTLRDGTR